MMGMLGTSGGVIGAGGIDAGAAWILAPQTWQKRLEVDRAGV